jgi:hypothetical protein
MAVKDLHPPAVVGNDAPNRIVVVTLFHNPGNFLREVNESLMDRTHFALLFATMARQTARPVLPAGDPRVRYSSGPRGSRPICTLVTQLAAGRYRGVRGRR